MKKILLILLVSLLGISGCAKSTPEVSNGIYKSEQSSLVYIQFDVDKEEFTFVHTSYSSYLPHGNFECTDGRIIAEDEEGTYVFEIRDEETIVFLEGESAEIPVEDQTVFRLDTD